MKLVPVYEAAAELAHLCYRVDNGEDLDQWLVQEFKGAETNLVESLDRRKAWLLEIESKIELIRVLKREADKQSNRYKRIAERLKDNTLQLVKAFPDLPWRDSMGKKVSIAKAKAKLIIDDGLVVEDLPEKYRRYHFETRINEDALRSDLENGVDLPWARLERKEYVRGL